MFCHKDDTCVPSPINKYYRLSYCLISPISDHHLISVASGTIKPFHTLPKIPGYKFYLSYLSDFPFWFSVLVSLLSEGAGSGTLN